MDKVRRQEHKELMAQGDEMLKGSRQLWLYNPENFTPEHSSEFGALKDLHLKVARAWAAKELFTKFWDYQEEGWARRFFKDWFGWVSRSRLKPVVEVAQMLRGCFIFNSQPFAQGGQPDTVALGKIPLGQLIVAETRQQP